MIRAFKNKWVGVSDEGLYEAVANAMTIGAGLNTSEFTVDDISIKGNPEFVTEADAAELYITTVKIP